MLHQTQSHASHPPKPTILDRLKRIESMLKTASFAAMYQHDQGAGAELYNISETTLFASEMLGDIAEELENTEKS